MIVESAPSLTTKLKSLISEIQDMINDYDFSDDVNTLLFAITHLDPHIIEKEPLPRQLKLTLTLNGMLQKAGPKLKKLLDQKLLKEHVTDKRLAKLLQNITSLNSSMTEVSTLLADLLEINKRAIKLGFSVRENK